MLYNTAPGDIATKSTPMTYQSPMCSMAADWMPLHLPSYGVCTGGDDSCKATNLDILLVYSKA